MPGKHKRTVTRDINCLEQQGPIKRVPPGVRANHELIDSFLPLRKVT